MISQPGYLPWGLANTEMTQLVALLVAIMYNLWDFLAISLPAFGQESDRDTQGNGMECKRQLMLSSSGLGHKQQVSGS